VATQDDKPQPSYPTSGYGIVDLFASWAPVDGPLVGWRLDLAVDNLFDHAYRRLSWDGGATPPAFYDVGRNVKIALRTQF
jgi:hemoglobin/transferrin/lactoferrin receptor protein